MATSTTRLGLREPGEGDNVQVQLDLNDNWDKVDAAVGMPISTTIPTSGVYAGRMVAVSTDSYRTYFSNGTSPASASWVEIPNSGSNFGQDLNLASTKKLIIGSDVNLYRNAANVLKTDDSLAVGTNLSVAGSAAITGVTALSAGLTGTTATFSGATSVGGALTVTGDLKPAGGAQVRRGFLSAQTTRANTTAEGFIASITIPANDAVAGACYRMKAWGTFGVTGTPTLNLRTRLGGVAGQSNAQTGAQTIQSGVTGRLWFAEIVLTNITTGASATWSSFLHVRMSGVLAGTAPFINDTAELTSIIDGTTAITLDSTVSNDWGLTATWSAASSSNTITCQGYIAERVA